MTPLATVHSIDGGTRAEQAAADLLQQIQFGQLVPGEIVLLADFAARRRVPVSSLRPLLETLEKQELLTVRGDTARIAPLNLAELRDACRLRNLIEKHLAARAFDTISVQELAALRTQVTSDVIARPSPPRMGVAARSDMLSQLCSHGASNWEDRIYRGLRRPIHRHFRLSFRGLIEDGAHATREELATLREMHRRAILHGFERRDRKQLITALDDCARFGQQVAELAFDYYSTPPAPRLL